MKTQTQTFLKTVIVIITSLFVVSFSSRNKEEKMIKGIVCLKIDACDYMIVCLEDTNYSVLEDLNGFTEEDDVIVGNLKSYGKKEAYNLTKKKSINVYVEEWEYTEESALEEWKNNCN